MKYIYNEIGSTFKEGDIILVVKESEDDGRSCRGCYYSSWKTVNGKKKRNYPYGCCVHRHTCTSAIRKDRKQVIFSSYKVKNI